MMESLYRFSFILLIAAILVACSTTAEVIEPEPEPEPEEVVEEAPAVALLSVADLSQYRINPADLSNVPQNEIHPVFELTPDDLQALSSNNGYRIQLLSTVNISEADSIRMRYYDWAIDQNFTIVSRMPEAYVVFRQPSYRVRVGDFRSRSRAIDFLNKIRPHFPGAWVVMDTIDPELVE